MKFSNPQGKEISAFATMVGGVVLGAMASRMAVAAIHTPTAGADATTAQKEKTMLLAKRGAIIVASGYAGAGISGTDTMAVLAKGACYGAAGMQTIDAVADLAKGSKVDDTSTKTKRVIASGFGLACPSSNSLNAPRKNWRKRALRMPAVIESPSAFSTNPLDVAFENSPLLAAS